MIQEPQHIKIKPEPTPDEREVILQAFEQLWPKDEKPPISYKWRFSGRWWAILLTRGLLINPGKINKTYRLRHQ